MGRRALLNVFTEVNHSFCKVAQPVWLLLTHGSTVQLLPSLVLNPAALQGPAGLIPVLGNSPQPGSLGWGSRANKAVVTQEQCLRGCPQTKPCLLSLSAWIGRACPFLPSSFGSDTLILNISLAICWVICCENASEEAPLCTLSYQAALKSCLNGLMAD